MIAMSSNRSRVAVLAVMVLAGQTGPAAADEDRHAAARALLVARCVECHGEAAQEGGLRLDSRGSILRGGEYGPVAIAGSGTEGELLDRIRTADADERMPPAGPPLTADEIASLGSWLADGLPWPGAEGDADRDPRLDHWAWQPIRRSEIPAPVAAFRSLPGVEADRNPIDAFVRSTLAAEGMRPTAVADRRTLIRRLSFDLLGLPPTPEEIDAFVADPDPRAYENLVERMLASPRYGERWARHWLDVVHYGDTHGYDKDKQRPNAWPYRDWVIGAFNADLPWDRFVADQIAGDVLRPDDAGAIEATGMLAAGPWDFIGHVEVPETKTDGKIARHLDRDDMVANTIGTFASVTIQCAQCHAHKFDPVSQEDYYSLQAVFAALDRTERTYSPDPAVMRAHAALDARRTDLDGRKQALEARRAEAAGPRLAEIDKALASPGGGNATPAFGWHSEIVADSGPEAADTEKWVQVDLGREVAVARVVLHPCHDDFAGIGAGFGFPRRFRIEGSGDPTFTGAVVRLSDSGPDDLPNPGTVPQSFTVDPQVGGAVRYVRVTATRLAPRQHDFIAAIAELDVLDADGTNLARGASVTAIDSIEAPPRWQRTNLVDGEFPAPSADAVALRQERDTILAKVPTEVTDGLREVEEELATLGRERAGLPALRPLYTVTATQRGGVPRPIHVLARGNVNAPGREVGPGSLSAVSMLPARFDLPAGATEGERRKALAAWLVSPDNPLTWRSAVNRVWLHHFGRGIVDTPSDFGRMGSPPSHPALLDWLAAEFRDHGGSLKDLHRLIVGSATWRQRADDDPDMTAVDAGNARLWRQNRRRLEAEAIRDAVLAAAGTLDLTPGGTGWQDFRIEHPEHSPHYRYDLADPADRSTWRRSIYRFIVRSQTQPFMTSLDCADPSMRVEKRNESLSAIQALALLNNGFMTTQAVEFAGRVTREAGDDPAAGVARAVRLAFGRPPTEEEATVLVALARSHGLAAVCRTLVNLNEFTFID
jgi:mono/diheme cytochrome c family protein